MGDDKVAPLRILYVEDSEHDRLAFRRSFDEAHVPHRITDCVHAEEAMPQIVPDASQFDVVVVDYKLPGMSGLDLCKELIAKGFSLPLVILTGAASEKVAVEAIKAGVSDYIVKDSGQGYLDLLPVILPQVVRKHADYLMRKQAEEALRESEAKYRELVETTDDLITRVDSEGRFIYVNHVAEKIFGVSMDQCIGMSAFDFVHPDDRGRTQEWFNQLIAMQKTRGTFENRHVNKITGEIYDMLWASNFLYDEEGNLTGVNGFARDLTKYKKLEDEVLRAKKLESVGILSGGIAHDFNNLLSIIMSNISMTKDDVKPEYGVTDFLNAAEKASIRAKDLTARLITFSRGGDPVKKVTSIGLLVKDSVKSALGGLDISPEFSISDDLFPVEIDEGQIKQVIHNIVINAQDAMAGEGTIKVNCENVTIGEKDALLLKDGKYVKISINDQGTGISEEDLPKVFDPYFSTKERGTEKGMGLGLSICHAIVDKHDGLVTVESELGEGTTLFIYLPASEKEIAELEPVTKPSSERPVIGRGKILVMDDEEMIRDTAIHVLSRFGYDAEVSRDGAEAIEMYKRARESGEPFDVVILDLTIRFGMGGTEAIQKLIEIDSDVKAIVSTGYSNDPVVTKFWEYGFRGVLTKPYTTDELDRALSGVISEE